MQFFKSLRRSWIRKNKERLQILQENFAVIRYIASFYQAFRVVIWKASRKLKRKRRSNEHFVACLALRSEVMSKMGAIPVPLG